MALDGSSIRQPGAGCIAGELQFTEGEIVFSTNESKARAIAEQAVVGFEVDRVDESLIEGWSVLVSGKGRRIEDPLETQRLSSLDLEAWAGGRDMIWSPYAQAR